MLNHGFLQNRRVFLQDSIILFGIVLVAHVCRVVKSWIMVHGEDYLSVSNGEFFLHNVF